MPILTYLKIGALLAAIAIVFGAGWSTRDAFCDAAAAKAELANVTSKLEAAQRDLDAAKLAAAASEAATASIEKAARAREEKIRELEADLAKKPGAECRRLDSDGVKRLLNIAPR